MKRGSTTPIGPAALLGLLMFAAISLITPEARAQAPTRCEVLDHARQWVENKVYYSQGPYGGYCRGSMYYDPVVGANYRPDCSGYVSAVWRRPAPGNTTYSFAGGPWNDNSSYIISYDDLLPGDALNFPGNPNVGTGHIRLFGGWVNTAKTRLWTYETSTCGTHAYRAEYNRSDLINNGYLPIRLRGIRDCAPPTPPAPEGPELIAQITGNGAITAVNWGSDEHNEVWVRSPDGGLYNTWNHAGHDWSPLERLTDGATCGFAAGYWPAEPGGYPEVFMPTTDGGSKHIWFQNGWKGPGDFGGNGLTQFSTMVWPDRRMEVFALSPSGELHQRFWVRGQDSSGWSDWRNMGGNLATGATAIVWGDGNPEIYATGKDGKVWHRWWQPDQNAWSDWSTLIGGDIASRPVPVRWDHGEVELFARGTDGFLHHAWHSDEWQPMRPLHSTVGTVIQGEPSAIINPPGNGGPTGAQVFVRDANNRLLEVHMENGVWQEFRTMPAGMSQRTLGSDPFAWVRNDGVTLLFAIDANGTLLRSHRDPANGWQPWVEIHGATVDPCVPAPAAPAGPEPPPAGNDPTPPPAGNEPPPAGNEPPPAGNEPPPPAAGDPGSSDPTLTPLGPGCASTNAPVPGASFALLAGLVVLGLRASRRRPR